MRRAPSTDIFPEIHIPVVSIIWTYGGLSARPHAQRAFDIASDRYKGGVDTCLDVITAEQSLLTP